MGEGGGDEGGPGGQHEVASKPDRCADQEHGEAQLHGREVTDEVLVVGAHDRHPMMPGAGVGGVERVGGGQSPDSDLGLGTREQGEGRAGQRRAERPGPAGEGEQGGAHAVVRMALAPVPAGVSASSAA